MANVTIIDSGATSLVVSGDVSNPTLAVTVPQTSIGLALTVNQGITVGSSFTNIAVAGQSNVVADSATDTLTLVAGSNVSITTDATTDTITINATTGGAIPNAYGVVVSDSGTATASTTSDTINILGGSGVSTGVSASTLTITNTDTGSAAVTAHLSAIDPHPTYQTQAESDLLYAALGHVHGVNDVPVMTATVKGLVPTPPNDATKFLNGAGTFTKVISVGTTAPATPSVNDLWVDTN